jgi:uncharacterized integral membrane protein
VLNTEILEYPNGETAGIKLGFVNKKVITLFGFEDMEEATKQIAQYIPDKGSIRRKRAKINWDNPVVMIVSGILTLAIILAVQEIGQVAYQFFNAAFFLVFGLYNLIGRPISRLQGKGWEKFETIISVVLIICSILMLVLTLFIVLK